MIERDPGLTISGENGRIPPALETLWEHSLPARDLTASKVLGSTDPSQYNYLRHLTIAETENGLEHLVSISCIFNKESPNQRVLQLRFDDRGPIPYVAPRLFDLAMKVEIDGPGGERIVAVEVTSSDREGFRELKVCHIIL